MSRRLVAVIDWRGGAKLKDNARFRGRGGLTRHRSLVLWEDGTGELRRFSTAATVRRLGGVIAKVRERKAGNGLRG